VQLDVDHIDGNHANDDPSNLQTLCANCHRLKTQVNADHMPIRGSITIINHGQLELNLDA
jgi:5-methylcytosine-specific restriction endonuclease McrA